MVYLQLIYIFLKVGLFGFGGGYAILSMIYQEIQVFGTITADDFSTLVGLSQVTPGPIAINSATYVGFRVAGVPGAFVASTAVTAPSFILLLSAVAFIRKHKENATLQNILNGIKPATVGLMATAFLFIAETALFANYDTLNYFDLQAVWESTDLVALGIAVVIFILIRTTKLSAITLTLLGGAMGLIIGIL